MPATSKSNKISKFSISDTIHYLKTKPVFHYEQFILIKQRCDYLQTPERVVLLPDEEISLLPEVRQLIQAIDEDLTPVAKIPKNTKSAELNNAFPSFIKLPPEIIQYVFKSLSFTELTQLLAVSKDVMKNVLKTPIFSYFNNYF